MSRLQAIRQRKKIWRTLEEPRWVDASVRFVPSKEFHQRVVSVTLHDWFGKEIELPNVHLYHKIKRGLRIYHVYSCTDSGNELFFRVLFCPQTQRVSVLGVSGPHIDSYS